MPQTKVFDLHCDTIDALAMGDVEPYSAMGSPAAGDLWANELALAGARMHDVGPWCQCFAIWVPDYLKSISALEFYRRARTYFHAQMEAQADRMTQVRDARAIEDAFAQHKVAAMLTVENGLPIGDDLRIIDEFASDGVKMVTLTWNAKNNIGSGHETTDGLSAFGRNAVRALEERRIVVDVSHLNDTGFWDLMKVARRPFAASHSNLRAVRGHRRNLTDDQFRAIVDTGGIVGINYCTEFLRDGAPRPDEVTFEHVAAHIERFCDLGGEDAIALGSDFDGCTTPAWLDSCEKVAGFHDLVAERFGSDLADKIFFQNAHDFFVRNETL